MKIKGLEFVCTCHWWPEQYDVKDSDGKIVGYVRLRLGYFLVEYPECDGETVFEEEFPICMKGRFDDDQEREVYLTAAADAILAAIARSGQGGACAEQPAPRQTQSS